MSIRYVTYRKNPIHFRTGIEGKRIAEPVPVTSATKFPEDDAAYLRSWQQWGDEGMQHVIFCLVGGPPAGRVPVAVCKDPGVPNPHPVNPVNPVKTPPTVGRVPTPGVPNPQPQLP